MTSLEISTRFLVSFFLAWILLSHSKTGVDWLKSGLVFSLVSCAFGITAELKGIYWSGIVIGAIVAAAILVAAFVFKSSRISCDLFSVSRQTVACAAGFFIGLGAVMVGIALSLFFLILDGIWDNGFCEKCSYKTITLLKIKAQEIRGIIGRVEGVLERFQLNSEQISVSNNNNEKELLITIKLILPEGYQKERLISAIREVEGIIQLAIE